MHVADMNQRNGLTRGSSICTVDGCTQELFNEKICRRHRSILNEVDGHTSSPAQHLDGSPRSERSAKRSRTLFGHLPRPSSIKWPSSMIPNPNSSSSPNNHGSATAASASTGPKLPQQSLRPNHVQQAQSRAAHQTSSGHQAENSRWGTQHSNGTGHQAWLGSILNRDEPSPAPSKPQRKALPLGAVNDSGRSAGAGSHPSSTSSNRLSAQRSKGSPPRWNTPPGPPRSSHSDQRVSDRTISYDRSSAAISQPARSQDEPRPAPIIHHGSSLEGPPQPRERIVIDLTGDDAHGIENTSTTARTNGTRDDQLPETPKTKPRKRTPPLPSETAASTRDESLAVRVDSTAGSPGPLNPVLNGQTHGQSPDTALGPPKPNGHLQLNDKNTGSTVGPPKLPGPSAATMNDASQRKRKASSINQTRPESQEVNQEVYRPVINDVLSSALPVTNTTDSTGAPNSAKADNSTTLASTPSAPARLVDSDQGGANFYGNTTAKEITGPAFDSAKFDSMIYAQPGTLAPPPGVSVEKQAFQSSLEIGKRQYLPVNPVVHGMHYRSELWHRRKAAEIAARPRRKAWFGKVTQRKRWLSRQKALAAFDHMSDDFVATSLQRDPEPRANHVPMDFGDIDESDLPEEVKSNPVWARFCSRFRDDKSQKARMDRIYGKEWRRRNNSTQPGSGGGTTAHADTRDGVHSRETARMRCLDEAEREAEKLYEDMKRAGSSACL